MAWTDPRTWVAGAKLTAAQLNTDVRDNLDFINDRMLGYAEVTSDQATITSEVDLTGLTTTVDVGTDRMIKITGMVHIRGTSVENVGTLRIKESTTVLNAAQSFWTRTNADGELIAMAIVNSPSAGSHTYKLSLQMPTGSGSIDMKASSTLIAFILVEDIGAA